MKIKYLRRKFIMMLIVFVGGISLPIATRTAMGTDRNFSTELAFNYGNAYFVYRTKEYDNMSGYVILNKKSSNCVGINAWFADSNKNRCTNIARCTALNNPYIINYTSNASKGSKVTLGVEDCDNTNLVHHSVEGIVNYR